jgi:hypothetical protein
MFVIVQPCEQRTWQELPGDDRRRFCDVCGHHIYAVNRYSTGELAALREAGGGKLCGMVGPTPRPRRRWVVLGLLSAVRVVFGQSARVRFVLTDQRSVRIPQAEVSVTGKGALLFRAKGDGASDVLLTLPVGVELRVEVQAEGFIPYAAPLRLTSPGEYRRAIELAPYQVTETVIGQTADLPVLQTEPPKRRSWWRRVLRRSR